MSSVDAVKTDLPSLPSLSDYFKELSLSSSSAAAPSTPASGKKSDEKAHTIMQQLALESAERDLHSAGRSARSSMPTKADASFKKTFTSILDGEIPNLLKATDFLCSRQSNELTPPVKQSKEHETQTALQMLLGSYKTCEPHMPHGEENSRKALHYRAIVNILFSELNFLNSIAKYLSCSIQGQYIQDMLFENLAVTFGPDGSYELAVPNVQFNFDDLDNFAFYLRFNKPLEAVKDFEEACQILKSQQGALSQFKASPNPGVVGLILHLNSELDRFGRERFEMACSDLAGKLATMDGSFKSPYISHLVRAICPSYGYLLCRHVQEFRKNIGSVDKGKVDPHLDRNNLAMQKKCFMDMLKGYLDKQIDIYALAFAKMRTLIQAKPAYKTTGNFESFDENPDLALYTPEQYKNKILELKKSIQNTLANSLPINQSLQLTDASKKEEKKEGKKEESKKEENKSDAVKSEATKEVSAAAGASAAASKKKKNKKKKAASASPAVIATPAVPAPANSAPASSAVVAMASNQKAPSASVNIARAVDSNAELVSFMRAPIRHHPAARVRRWLSIQPRDLTKIRSFEDPDKGQIVQKYKNLTQEQLKLQLLLHGFTPLVDRILNDPAARKKYCYPTKTGLGMFVDVRTLDALGAGIKGVIFYGLDKSIYFHRKIDPLTMERIEQVSLSQLVEESAQTVLQNISKEPTGEELAVMEKELQSEFVGDTVTPDKHEILHFKDDKLKCQVSVFPLC